MVGLDLKQSENNSNLQKKKFHIDASYVKRHLNNQISLFYDANNISAIFEVKI